MQSVDDSLESILSFYRVNGRDLKLSKSQSGQGSLKGRWGQALRALALALLWVLFLRWIFFEPYVIPSGSMIPTLKIQDYILVNKFHYGLRVPFTDHWLWTYRTPERGDVIIFRFKHDEHVYFVKRVVGVAGDRVAVDSEGRLVINDQIVTEPTDQWLSEADAIGQVGEGRLFRVFKENLNERTYNILIDASVADHGWGPVEVPDGSLFMMGDNRDRSADSRRWGFVPVQDVIGRASFIFWSCDTPSMASPGLCSPERIRTERIFKRVE